MLLSISRAYGGEPYTSRYIYPAAFLVVLLALELGPSGALSRRAVAALSVVAVAAAALNAGWLRVDASRMRDEAQTLAVQLGALGTTRGVVEPSFVIDRRFSGGMPAAAYFAATDRLGPSPADTPRELARRREDLRLAADDLLRRAVPVGPIAYTGAARRLIEAGRSGALGGKVGLERSGRATAVRRRRGCITARPDGAEAIVEVALPAAGAVVDGARVTTRLRRFAAGYTQPSPSLSGPTFLPAPRGTVALPWRAVLSSQETFRIC